MLKFREFLFKSAFSEIFTNHNPTPRKENLKMQNREKIVKKRKPLFELKSTNYHADGAYYTPGLRKFKLLDTLLIESHLLKYVVSGFF